eukprot:11181652-Lingulodinium_polyedra.AAC.1
MRRGGAAAPANWAAKGRLERGEPDRESRSSSRPRTSSRTRRLPGARGGQAPIQSGGRGQYQKRAAQTKAAKRA